MIIASMIYPSNKRQLIKFMNMLGFGIVDIKYENDCELYAHKLNNIDQLTWFPLENGGLGFVQLFKGAIKNACQGNEGDKLNG